MLCSETGREVMVRRVTQAMMGCSSLVERGGSEGWRMVQMDGVVTCRRKVLHSNLSYPSFNST